MRAARLLLVLACVGWVMTLVAAPAVAFGAPISGLTYAFSSFLCHQRPDRSFHVAGAQFPVCARCLGLYVGAALGAISALALGGAAIAGGTPSRARLRAWVLAAAVPTAVTWGSEVVGLWAPGNVGRFVAALPLGAAVVLTVNYVGCARPPRTGLTQPPTSP